MCCDSKAFKDQELKTERGRDSRSSGRFTWEALLLVEKNESLVTEATREIMKQVDEWKGGGALL